MWKLTLSLFLISLSSAYADESFHCGDKITFSVKDTFGYSLNIKGKDFEMDDYDVRSDEDKYIVTISPSQSEKHRKYEFDLNKKSVQEFKIDSSGKAKKSGKSISCNYSYTQAADDEMYDEEGEET